MNNFKSGKSLFGISSSGSSGLFVDLLTNQSINGIKTFLSNLITNSNVNFNTSANVGRIVFKPNEAPGFGGNLLTIYTEDENDAQGWNFDADGNLYYLGIGLSPIKIIFEPTGNITAINNISSANVLCDTIQSFSGGNITINNNLALGSNTISTTGSITGGAGSFTTGAFSSNVNITGDINCGNISAGSGTISTTGPINVGSINATSLNTGSGPITGGAGSFTTGAFSSNVNITGDINCGNISAGSGTISTTGAINVGSINATSLNTGSGPITGGAGSFTTGAFSSNVNITGDINCGNISAGSGTISTTGAVSTGAITCTALNASSGTIQTTGAVSTGAITCTALNASAGTIQTTGAINGGVITASTSFNSDLIVATTGTATKNSIMLDNQFIDGTNGSIDLKAHFVGFPYLTESLSLTSKYMFIKPLSDGNFEIQINNIASKVFSSNWSTLTLTSAFNLALGSKTITTTGAVSTGAISCSSLNASSGTIQTTGIIECNTFSAVTTNTYKNKIEMTNLYASASIGEIDIISQYIAVVHPSNALSSAAKYGFFRTQTNGDTDFNINNISGAAWGTRWGNREFYTDFTLQCQKAGFTSGYLFSKFSNSGGVIGSISMLTASTVAYNVSSDYRLKQDIKPLEKSLDRIMKLQPKSYRFIKDVEYGQDFIFDGFIAHEVEDIVPMSVSGKKDDPEVFQQLDYSKFTPLCVSAIQELNELVQKQQTLIDTLIKRIEILENNVVINKE
jgi:hypothetical protein